VNPQLQAKPHPEGDLLPPMLRDLYAAVSPDLPEHCAVVVDKRGSSWK
jgi:hypothetical protein